MNLDPTTSGVLTAVVVATIGATFIGTTLSRRFDGGARLWGIGFLLQLVAVLCTLLVALFDASPETATWAHALANAATVGAAGCILLGFRSYNRLDVAGPSLMVTALAFLVAAGTVVERPLIGVHGGVLLFSLVLAGVCAGAAVHALIGRTRSYPAAWICAASSLVFGAYHLLRAAGVLATGADSAPVEDWFGPVSASLLILSFGTVSSLCLFMLRSELSTVSVASATAAPDEVLGSAAFLDALRSILRRAAHRTDLVVVIAVIVDDVGAITASFGQEVAEATTRVLRAAVREFASPIAVVGASEDRTIILVASTASSPADARRQAGLLYRGVIERFVGAHGIVVPGVGVGVASSQSLGYGPEALVEGATIAAVEASESDETSVVFANLRSLPVNPFSAEADGQR